MLSAQLYQALVVLLISHINVSYSTGKIYTTDENQQYYINEDQQYTWFDALGECLKLNMTLVAIETSTKSQEINTLVTETFGKTVVLWVGGIMTRNEHKRNYNWITTGQLFNYTFWKGTNNPDFTNDNEYCIEIGWGVNMEWNDDYCGRKYGFICEHNDQLDLKQNNPQQKLNLQEMQKSLLALQQDLEKHEQLKEKLQMKIIKREKLQQELTMQKQERMQQLQQIVENGTMKQKQLIGNLQTEIKEENQFLQILQKQHLQLVELLKEKLQKQQNLLKTDDEKIQIEAKNRKYRDSYFQFIMVNH
ncbi:lectin subunit alpha-like [Calliphora vicina]|uniref:lectin subunit alpha-like n=1 Tax=Calliphora vicina TaxID=7373 RepID=UPI00325BD7C9